MYALNDTMSPEDALAELTKLADEQIANER